MQTQVETYANFTTQLQSQLKGHQTELAGAHAKISEMTIQMASSDSANNNANPMVLEQISRERDAIMNKCGQLSGEVSEFRQRELGMQEEMSKMGMRLKEEEARKATLEGKTIHTLGLIELDRLQCELEQSVALQLSALKNCVTRKEQKLREQGGGGSDGPMDALLDELKCPLTKQLFKEPVTAADGHTYEREAIEEYLNDYGGVSPVTGQQLPHKFLTPNHICTKLVGMDHLGGFGGEMAGAEESFFG